MWGTTGTPKRSDSTATLSFSEKVKHRVEAYGLLTGTIPHKTELPHTEDALGLGFLHVQQMRSAEENAAGKDYNRLPNSGTIAEDRELWQWKGWLDQYTTVRIALSSASIARSAYC